MPLVVAAIIDALWGGSAECRMAHFIVWRAAPRRSRTRYVKFVQERFGVVLQEAVIFRPSKLIETRCLRTAVASNLQRRSLHTLAAERLSKPAGTTRIHPECCVGRTHKIKTAPLSPPSLSTYRHESYSPSFDDYKQALLEHHTTFFQKKGSQNSLQVPHAQGLRIRRWPVPMVRRGPAHA